MEANRQAALIDAAKGQIGLQSDYALCKAWGIAFPTLSGYRAGKHAFDAYMINRVAEALDKDPREITAEVELAKNPSGKRREYWETLLKKRSGVASVGGYIAACIAMSALLGSATPNAEAAKTAGRVPDNTLPIMRTWWRRFTGKRRLARCLLLVPLPRPLALTPP